MDNLILHHLPVSEQEILRPHLQPVTLEVKQELDAAGGRVRHIHFPTTCVIGVMDLQPSGRLVEVNLIGKEGCSGFWVLQGLTASPCQTLIQVDGRALRLDATILLALSQRLPILQQMLIRFSGLILHEAITSVGCSQHHSVEQRLGRWLLAHHYRTGGMTAFPFTHEFLAEQLGVLRNTVSETLANLQNRGLVRSGYGKIELVDIPAMQAVACECLSVVKQAVEDYSKYVRDVNRYRRPTTLT